MNNLSDKIETMVGSEQLSRLLDVLNILGVNTLEKMDISLDGSFHNLNPDKNKEITITKNMISMALKNSDYTYCWHSVICEDKSIDETFNIFDNNYGDLVVKFFTTPYATTTSGFYLYNDVWGSPKIYSDIFNVTIGCGEKEQVFPIDDYFDIVDSCMKNKDKGFYSEYNLTRDPKVGEIIIKMYEKPIKNLVYSLKNDDQSMRFLNEESNIFSEYIKTVTSANNNYLKKLETALSELNCSMQLAEETKDKGIARLKKLDQKYFKRIKIN